MKALSLALFLVVILNSSCAKPELSDDKIREKLVGTWLPDKELARTLSGELTYKKDFTFDGFILVKRPDLTLRWDFAGKWKVKANNLALEYTTSSIPALAPVGKITSDHIVAVTDTELTFITEEGKRQVRVRKEENKFLQPR